MVPDPTGFTVDAILCDSVVTADGKLYLQGGGWHVLGADSFPFRQSRIGLGVILGVPYTATNQNHTLSMRLEDEDGQQVQFGPVLAEQERDGKTPAPIEARFNIGRPARIQPGEAQLLPFAINLDQLQFDKPATYSFVIDIDGNEVKRLIFRVTSGAGMLNARGVA